MSASPKTRLLASTLAAVIAVPFFTTIAGVAYGQGPGPALTPYPACANKPTAQDSEAAHSAYLLGKRFFEESDYGSASHNFIDAYKLDCSKPELLLNIARANELLGNRAESVHALETYLQRAQSLSPDEKVQLQRRIDNLKAALAAQAASAAVVAPATKPAPTDVTPVASTTPPPAAVLPPPTQPDERGHTVAPWILTGVGAAAVIAGGSVWLVGSKDVSDAKNVCGSNGNCPKTAAGSSAASTGTTGNTLETAGGVTFIVGLGAIAGGLLWHFLEPTGPINRDATKATFTPVVGPGYSGASVVGSF
jgi:hypothetical protein